MGFWDDLAKDLSLWTAVQASKDKDGKPDPYKAAGMAAGMGNFSFSDQMRLGAMLGSQGAFDDDPIPEISSGLGLDDFDDGLDDELDFSYLDNVGASQYEWRETCEDGSEYSIFPEDYETEEEYMEALEEAQLARENTSTAPTEISIPIKLTFSVECPALDKLDAIKESDYPNKRLYEAACKKVKLETGLMVCADDEIKTKELKQCDFILNNYKTITAANYLSVEFGEFLYAQAIKENFKLPKSVDLPDEDLEMKTSFDEIFRRIYEVDKKLAFEVWKWCLEKFTPYKEHSSYGETFVTREIIDNAYMFDEGFLSDIAKHIINDADFGRFLMEHSPQVDSDYGEIFYVLLKNNQVDLVKELFSICINKKMEGDYCNGFISGIIGECSNYEELETMELFRDNLFPMVETIKTAEVRRNITGWRKEIEEYIDEVENTCEKYEFSRKNAWRKKWLDEAKKYNIDIKYYDNEDEFLAELADEKQMLEDEQLDDEPVVSTTSKAKTTFPTINAEEREKILNDKTIYTYCSVVFQETNRPYHYRTDGENIKIGDKVVVPVGPDNEERIATVTSIEKHMRISVPFPVEKTKKIIRKIEE